MSRSRHLWRSTYLSLSVAGSSANSKFEQWELESAHRPRFGRNWWFWLPSLQHNGGRFRDFENTDTTLRWLCFSASLTVFARS